MNDVLSDGKRRHFLALRRLGEGSSAFACVFRRIGPVGGTRGAKVLWETRVRRPPVHPAGPEAFSTPLEGP